MKCEDTETRIRTEEMHRPASAALFCRLEVLLAKAKMPNGTSGAAAVHTVIMAELLASGCPITDLEGISDKLIRQTCRDLGRVLNSGDGTSFGLPFGTTAVSPTPGTLTIGQQQFVLDAGRAGLHPLDAVARDAHDPNFKLLVTLIRSKTRNLACRRLGVPTPKHIVDNDSRHVIQFAPLAEAGGVVLQRPAGDTGADRFCAALPWQIEALADSMVADMRMLWRRRVEIGARVHELRLAAEAGLRAEPGLDCQARVDAISIQSPDLEIARPSLYIEYHAIDEALRPGVVLSYVPEFRGRDGVLPPPYQMLYRVGIREQLAQFGATGWIDGPAAAVARAAPQGRAAVLARLAEQYDTTVVFPTRYGALCADLYWQEGRITLEASLPGKFVWTTDELRLNGVVLPDAILQGLQGRTLSEVIELPFGGDLTIIDARVGPDGLVLTLEPNEKLVNCERGAILDTASPNRNALIYGIQGN